MSVTKVIEPGSVTIKSAAEGTFSAVFATLGVVDRDGDVTLPGGIRGRRAGGRIRRTGTPSTRAPRRSGRARIRTTREEAIVDAQLYMETTAGRDTFSLLKARGARQQSSYGFDVLQPARVHGRRRAEGERAACKLRVREISPVWEGAGVGTRLPGGEVRPRRRGARRARRD